MKRDCRDSELHPYFLYDTKKVMNCLSIVLTIRDMQTV